MARRSARVQQALSTPPKGRAPKLSVVTEGEGGAETLEAEELAAPTSGENEASSVLDANTAPSTEAVLLPRAPLPATNDSLTAVESLTGRYRRSGIKMARVTISVPDEFFTVVEATERRLSRETGKVMSINKSALIEQAALRVLRNPDTYPPLRGTLLEGGTPFHGTCPEPVWTDVALVVYVTYGVKQPGKSVVSAAFDVLNSLTASDMTSS